MLPTRLSCERETAAAAPTQAGQEPSYAPDTSRLSLPLAPGAAQLATRRWASSVQPLPRVAFPQNRRQGWTPEPASSSLPAEPRGAWRSVELE